MSGKDIAPIFRSSDDGVVTDFDRDGMLAGRERHTNARRLKLVKFVRSSHRAGGQ